MNNIDTLILNDQLPISVQLVPQEQPFAIFDGQLQQTVASQDVTPASDFPLVDPQWFYDGLPGSLVETGPLLEGDPIDFVPVPYYVQTGPISVTVQGTNEPNIVIGFLDGNKNPVTIPYNAGSVPTNAIAFYVLFDAGYFRTTFPESILARRNRWMLLSDFGGIGPGSTASQTLSLTSGFTTTETRQFAIEIGASIGGSGGGLSANLSTKVTESFSTSITFSQQQTVSTTVNFTAQPVAQRIGMYQFCSEYEIIPGPAFQEFSDTLLNSGSFLVPLLGATAPFLYPSNRFQKVFVLEPQ